MDTSVVMSQEERVFMQEARGLLWLCLKTVDTSLSTRAICTQVWDAERRLPNTLFDMYEKEIQRQLKSMFKSWPHFSGVDDFPVPAPDVGADPEAHYFGMGRNEKWSGVYGESRKHLLAHCIKEASKRVR